MFDVVVVDVAAAVARPQIPPALVAGRQMDPSIVVVAALGLPPLFVPSQIRKMGPRKVAAAVVARAVEAWEMNQAQYLQTCCCVEAPVVFELAVVGSVVPGVPDDTNVAVVVQVFVVPFADAAPH